MIKINKILIKKYAGIRLLLVIIVTILAGLIYLTVQQSLRQSANDPQIQIAEDISAQLNTGAPPSELNSQNKTDIAKSLNPYLIVYDSQGKVIASTAQLDGNTPIIPLSVLENAKIKGENRVTWQPRAGVRSAIVAVPFNGQESGYVVVGRSLREVEKRVKFTLQAVGIFWLAIMAAILAFSVITWFLKKE